MAQMNIQKPKWRQSSPPISGSVNICAHLNTDVLLIKFEFISYKKQTLMHIISKRKLHLISFRSQINA